MTYAVANLHGCFSKFKKLLKQINFNDNDVMYVLGDIVDYGDEPIELLCDLSMRYNVIPIVGEHDLRALRLLRELEKMLGGKASPDPEVIGEMTEWIRDGGQKTMEGFKALDDDMKEGVIEYLEDMSLYEELEDDDYIGNSATGFAKSKGDSSPVLRTCSRLEPLRVSRPPKVPRISRITKNRRSHKPTNQKQILQNAQTHFRESYDSLMA